MSAPASGVDFQNVHFVVNYDLPTHRGMQDKYLHRMGRFRGVNAINFVTPIDWTMLFEIQNLYNGVVFEVHPLLKTSETINGIRQFLLCGDRHTKVDNFLIDVRELILKTKSVLFVPECDILLFEQRLHSLLEEFNIFDELSKFTRCKSPCVLVTSDIGAMFGYPLEVPLVINYHLPLSTQFYDRRIACCKSDGAVLHFVREYEYDWPKLFYIQSRYNCVLNRIRYDGAADLVEPYVTED
ncbi:hypothetical protein AQUCO_05700052v1 [Aquilegia coerulea]|uniref:ATP-dependent RNA helicase n=1 Tax=Aquilegia coerulea TaxID=218851 RepID=A0A2G5CFL9_AQUCA|nr:hypothetical protein AQUCO_05700052v1 [Aquilegia coerulea]